MDYKTFKTHFQYLIIKGLRPKKRKILYQTKFLINQRVYLRLKKDGVSGRFKTNETLLKKLKLHLTSFIDTHQYCTCQPSTFKLRVGKQAPVNSFNQINSQLNQFNSGTYIFSFQFIRYEQTNRL